MAGHFSQTIILGNVGKDPEIRTTQGAQKVASFTLATSETWKDRQSGEKREKTEWHRVVCWNEGLTSVIERFVRKGSKVQVIGQNQTRKWTDRHSQDRYTTEVVIQKFGGDLVLCGEPAGEGCSSSQQSQPRQQAAQQRSGGWDAPSGNDLDDEIPF
ncbi:single-stranded DNA-binding protein [Komagataeibacter diospyri]|uniref:Single-stranded DNA-binding protein n=1 Tax=Komagataeibacter diospyri TaxID=1932662 RepID=A0A4P5NZP4_9PROT|nr:single-stranded DNA-binding protein [Komagataeibacter diospyri]GCE85135.1 single-strand DNA binding protein Ssb [Komagataeibacter diospyri]